MTEEPLNPRKRFSRTLSGDEPAAELDDDGQSVAERLRPQGNTLLGHPPTPAAGPTVSGQPGPVLAPPKWRGAGAYRAGEEPQPQVSLIPAPPPMAAAAAGKPLGVPIGVMRSSVKTKMGQPPPPAPRPPEPAAANPPSEPPAAGDDTLKDTIQQMLEQQTSVPIQVEEGIPELPNDELVDEEAAQGDASGEEDTQRPPPDLPEAQQPLEPTAVRSDEEGAPAAVAHAGSAESEPPPAGRAPEAAAAEQSSEPAEPPPEGRRRERRPVASLTPIQTPRSLVPRWDSEAVRGVLFVVAMVVVGGGGWLVTRGGYQPRMTVTPPSAVAKPDAPAATAETTKPAEAAPAAPEARTATTPAPATTDAPASKESSAQRTARKPRAASAEEVEQESEAPAAPAERTEPTGVLTVTPRAEEAAADLPDSPTRDNVIATLNGLRPAFLECAQGQRGVAQLDITLTDSGSVSHVVVGGDFAGSTQGSCIARAARNAQFAPFKKPRFRLVYPISL